MLQPKRCTHISIKKHNKKSLNFYCSHYQILFINTVLNINELTNLSKSVLKTKFVRIKLIKNAINTVSNTVNIFASLK